jgi:RNA polymerase sigma-70 factor (ECF subfamily)
MISRDARPSRDIARPQNGIHASLATTQDRPSAMSRSNGAAADPGVGISTIRLAQRGDRDALRAIYEHHAASVNRYVRSIVRDPLDAEDVTHNIFVKLFDVISQYEPRGVPFSAWLLRVARNAAMDYVRSKRAIPVADVPETTHGDLESSIHRSHDLHAALADLPPAQREILILRHVVGLSPVEIAVRLDRTEASVHGLHHRGRAALKARLQEMTAGPVVRESRVKSHAAA